ncbi:preprotein translocase subunit TatA [Mycolicibacterium novocastrense]|uniref:Sec-independent protein translocase protein TatA n=1 Tax=Mycolicibacterium novocastrense TaxID=59813 RepID=A0AAW5SMA8_MYCNV|nr:MULTISPECIES: Sec-independent protein translocase subunit TatA [Mycobacteriaceae]KUH71954.1 preprotein translocase subunit TatA [Mycolicibacterium novocastrense]KUH72127.1 preprotein translocase subunit TatA [Mycolicibacterium novocastrense]KUH73078.1 preprotein translocase subunit TatA [Mycolicibacterium novocastrense]KUI37874.1 preprotein translocase subunit TatA [Mycobacterium sp. IS-1590]MCV7025091.1 Sec-independent protein translocase subunit TatA [Mycolicibacterium novocastrense]
MGGLQPWHWVIVIAVFVLLFGAKKLPDAARSLGKSMRIFKSEIKEMQADSKSDTPPATPIASERVDNAAPDNATAPATEHPSDKRPA